MSVDSHAFARTTVTAALPYANGPVHIGHLAGAYLPADIYVRYLRAVGHPVLFVCGSDEHGAAITIRARKDGQTPQAIVDHYHPMLRDAFAALGIQFDHYSRTSNPIHHQTAQEFFETFHAAGKLEVQETEQLYDPVAQMFLADRYVVGTCPKCGHPEAYGDQCEKCGSSLQPTDLIQPRSTLSGATPEMRTTQHWYLPLDKFQGRIQAFIDQHPEWKAHVLGQCRSWLHDGLRPRSITRDLDWGVDVPLPEAAGKKLYVWFDAPIGYISATREYFEEKGQPDEWRKWWQPQADPQHNARIVHFIGKDNIVFHCIIFPAMLMEHGQYLWADQVPANEFLNLEGDKISTSRDWAVWAHEYMADFAGKADVLRYVLTAIMPETKDSEFTWADFQTRNNSELVGIFGNFVNRALVLLQKYHGGMVPTPGPLTDDDLALQTEVRQQAERLGHAIEQFHFRDALAALMDIARAGNKYLADQQPWHVVKHDPDRAATTLFVALQVVAALQRAASPFLPDTALKISQMLRADAVERKDYRADDFFWSNKYLSLDAANALIPAGHTLGTPALLFEKLEDSVIQAQVDKLHAKRAARAAAATPEAELAPPAIAPLKPEIQFDDFAKLDIRIGTVLAAERVPKADKLLRLTVDLGECAPDGTPAPRTIISGIAEYFAPEALVGRQMPVLANLAPRKLRGIESQGMILMADGPQGLSWLSPDQPLPSGSGVS